MSHISSVQHHLLEHQPWTRWCEGRVRDVVLEFDTLQRLLDSGPQLDLPIPAVKLTHLNQLIMVHWEALTWPRPGEIWICEVDRNGWAWPVERVKPGSPRKEDA
jgi:hypothetical protein